MKRITLIILFIGSAMTLIAQNINLQEQLGYDANAKLLIIHADDAGVSQATNQAVADAFAKEGINSTAIMVPCPWFPQMAEYAWQHPEQDYGLHLTFTSEWANYKWGGVAPSSEISSLLTRFGYFYETNPDAVNFAIPEEVEIELRAQIEKALAAGIKPSHFDTHMNTVFGNADLLRIYMKLGKEYKVPVMLTGNTNYPDELQIPEIENYPKINVYSPGPDVKPEDWNSFYLQTVHSLQPGVSEIIVHLAYDNEETRAMTSNLDDWDAKWRQRDMDLVMSREFADALKENNIQLIRWKDIQKVMYPDVPEEEEK
jgi:predicted glycoside hydrolase/deacetylase ChbG (UPF0249 family)